MSCTKTCAAEREAPLGAALVPSVEIRQAPGISELQLTQRHRGRDRRSSSRTSRHPRLSSAPALVGHGRSPEQVIPAESRL